MEYVADTFPYWAGWARVVVVVMTTLWVVMILVIGGRRPKPKDKDGRR